MPYFDLQKQKKQPCTAQLKLLNISGFLFLTVLVSKQFTKNWFHNIKYHQSLKKWQLAAHHMLHTSLPLAVADFYIRMLLIVDYFIRHWQ